MTAFLQTTEILTVLLCYYIPSFLKCGLMKKVPLSWLSELIIKRALRCWWSVVHPLLSFFFLFRGNGNSSLCVKFGPGNKECVNCLAHISGVPFKDSFKLHWTHSVVCYSPSHSCLYWSLVISKGSYLWWCMSDIVYSAGKGLWEWNRKTNLIAH